MRQNGWAKKAPHANGAGGAFMSGRKGNNFLFSSRRIDWDLDVVHYN
jgi:hypothetical protein